MPGAFACVLKWLSPLSLSYLRVETLSLCRPSAPIPLSSFCLVAKVEQLASIYGSLTFYVGWVRLGIDGVTGKKSEPGTCMTSEVESLPASYHLPPH
jgi:hypothetical protein